MVQDGDRRGVRGGGMARGSGGGGGTAGEGVRKTAVARRKKS